MSERLTITIASVPHRETPVAELWCGDYMWAEAYQDEGEGVVSVDVYPNPTGAPWHFDHADLTAALDEAKAKLKGTHAGAPAIVQSNP
jgi:hypothetical protein